MLQNRVDPQGNLIKTSARGAWLGNRGQLHGKGKAILRPFKHQAWIICELQFKDRHRQIMAPNLWTELFFLDEATAFAAGHRPCFECRRDDAKRFKTAWLQGNPDYGFDIKTPIGKIDEIIHAERIDKQGNKVTSSASAGDLPDGTFVLIGEQPFLLWDGKLHQWTPFGYDYSGPVQAGKITVLTPRSMVEAFRAGYVPQVGLAGE